MAYIVGSGPWESRVMERGGTGKRFAEKKKGKGKNDTENSKRTHALRGKRK